MPNLRIPLTRFAAGDAQSFRWEVSLENWTRTIIRVVLPVTLMLLAAGCGDISLAEDNPSLVVHEWGTITTKHYGNGRIAGGMNFVEK